MHKINSTAFPVQEILKEIDGVGRTEIEMVFYVPSVVLLIKAKSLVRN